MMRIYKLVKTSEERKVIKVQTDADEDDLKNFLNYDVEIKKSKEA